MEELFTTENYRNYLINYYEDNSDWDKLEQRKERISHYSDEFFEEIIKNTDEFCHSLLEQMKQEGHVLNGKMFIDIALGYRRFEINNGCKGTSPCDTLYTFLDDEAFISEYLLKQRLKNFSIHTNKDVQEEIICDIVATFPANVLLVSCSIEEFKKAYNDNSNRTFQKRLIK